MRAAEQVFECPDHPDVFLEQVGRAACAFGCREQGFTLVGSRQLEEIRHESLAR